MPLAHARLSASSAERWMNCPGSVRLCEHIPNPTSRAAAEGTFAHQIAADCLTEAIERVEDCPPSATKYVGRKGLVDGFEFVCDEGMAHHINVYLNFCASFLEAGADVEIEMPLLGALSEVDSDMGGTADFVAHHEVTDELVVVDFKYGKGVLVDHIDNTQAKIYALGAALAISRPVRRVCVTIVQPRIDHPEGSVRSWEFPIAELLDFVGALRIAAAATREPDAPLVPNADAQCYFCPARGRHCPALEQAQHVVLAAQFDATAYNPATLAEWLRLADLAEVRIKALRAFAYAEATKGTKLPGWKLVDKRASRVWADKAEAEKRMFARGVEPRHPGELKSPAQLEEELGRSKAVRAEFADLIVSVSSGTTLVPESDKRQAATPAVAADSFPALLGDSTAI